MLRVRGLDVGRMETVSRIALGGLCMVGAVRAIFAAEWSWWGSTAGTLTVAGVLAVLAVGHVRGSEVAAKISAAIGGVALLMLVPYALGAYSAFDSAEPGRVWHASRGSAGIWAFSALSLINYAFVATRSGTRGGP